jgi:hypothetical protein
MTSRTTIPTDPNNNTGSPDGPIDCARCGLSLVDREPDDSTPDAGIWIHDTGDGDLAICDDCHAQSQQAACWIGLARWRNRAENRGHYFGRDGLTVYEGQIMGPTFPCKKGKLPVEDVLGWLATDPLGMPRIMARLEKLADKYEPEECPETERNLEHLGDKAESLIGGMR